MTAPPLQFRQVKGAPSLVDCRKCRYPAARLAEPTIRMGRQWARLVVAGNDRHVDAAAREAPDRSRSIAGHPARGEFTSRRKPEGQTVNPTARPMVANIRKGQVARNLVAPPGRARGRAGLAADHHGCAGAD